MKIQDLIEGCKHGEYYCSTDKKWKCRQGPKQTREGVVEGFKNMYAEFSGYGNYMQGRAVNVLKHFGLEVVKKEYTEDDDIQTYVVKGDRQSIEKAGEYLERNAEQFGGYHFVKQGVAEGSQPNDIAVYHHTGPNADKKAQAHAIKLGSDYGHFRHDMADKNDNLHIVTQKRYFPAYAKQQGVAEEKQRLDPSCWDGYKKDGTKMKGDTRVNNCVKEELEETYDGDEFFEAYGELWYNEDEQLDEAEYQGRSVPLGKPMQGDVKKFKVYVKDPSTGNVKKVNFGDPDMKIRKSNPAARRSFRARHNCDNPGPRTKARYWSCRKW